MNSPFIPIFSKGQVRNYYGQLPFGTIDGLQILLLMSGDTERHVKQMEEVMAQEDFPEEKGVLPNLNAKYIEPFARNNLSKGLRLGNF